MSTSQRQLESFTSLLRKTFSYIEKYFLEMLFAVAIPVIVSYVFLWIMSANFISDFNSATSLDDILALVSLDGRTLYITLITLTIALFMNLIAVVAAPLTIVRHATISYKEIFPMTLKYIGPYLLMLIIMGLLLVVAIFLANLVMAIILLVGGIISEQSITILYEALSYWLPTLFTMVAFLLFTFAPFYLIDKNYTAWQSIKHSMQLVKNNFWGVAIRIGILSIILLVLSFMLKIIPVVGPMLVLMVSGIIATIYNYVLYTNLTTDA